MLRGLAYCILFWGGIVEPKLFIVMVLVGVTDYICNSGPE